MKLTVIGGGGVRSMFLAKSIAQKAAELHITELVFMDNDGEKLRIYGGLAAHVSRMLNPELKFRLTTDAVDAVKDADYIITTIRVGGDHMRVREERIALANGVLGQETTGAAGLSFAMRSVPALAEYCELIRQYAKPTVKVFNFTNPAGVVSQTLRDMGYDFTYGICDAPSELIRELPAILGCEERDLSVECYGLNHFSWFTHFTVRGEEVTERLIASPELYQKTAMQYFSPELVRLCDNQLLNEYLYYYYYRDEALKAIQGAGETRGEQIARINQEMREALRTVDARTQPEAAFTIWMQHYLRRENSYMQNESRQEKFHTREPLTLRQFIEEPDTGGYAGVALDILEAVNSTTTKRIVVSIQNHDTLDFLRPDDVIEISCDLSRDGLKPVTPVKVPTAQKNMIACVKEYERLAVAAILQQDKSLAVRALMAHPLIGSYSLAKTLVEAYLDDEQFAAWR